MKSAVDFNDEIADMFAAKEDIFATFLDNEVVPLKRKKETEQVMREPKGERPYSPT